MICKIEKNNLIIQNVDSNKKYCQLLSLKCVAVSLSAENREKNVSNIKMLVKTSTGSQCKIRLTHKYLN